MYRKRANTPCSCIRLAPSCFRYNPKTYRDWTQLQLTSRPVAASELIRLRVGRHEVLWIGQFRLKAINSTFGVYVRVVRLWTRCDLDPLLQQGETASTRAAVVAQSQKRSTWCSDDAASYDFVNSLNVIDKSEWLCLGIRFENASCRCRRTLTNPDMTPIYTSESC